MLIGTSAVSLLIRELQRPLCFGPLGAEMCAFLGKLLGLAQAHATYICVHVYMYTCTDINAAARSRASSYVQVRASGPRKRHLQAGMLVSAHVQNCGYMNEYLHKTSVSVYGYTHVRNHSFLKHRSHKNAVEHAWILAIAQVFVQDPLSTCQRSSHFPVFIRKTTADLGAKSIAGLILRQEG